MLMVNKGLMNIDLDIKSHDNYTVLFILQLNTMKQIQCSRLFFIITLCAQEYNSTFVWLPSYNVAASVIIVKEKAKGKKREKENEWFVLY